MMTLNGEWWLLIIILIAALLFIVAWRRRDQAKPLLGGAKNKIQPSSDLSTLQKRIRHHFPELTTTLRHNRILIQSQHQKKLMMTIDPKVKAGARPLGEAVVINFHKLPSATALKQAVDSQLKPYY